MKAKDFMQGDWVYIHHGGKATHYGKVAALLSNSIDVDIDDGSCLASALCTSVDPIPLTPEILEKNGFEEFDGWRILDMDDVEIRWIGTILEISGSHGNMELPNVQCVHELQRALRCVGLFELANNIKL